MLKLENVAANELSVTLNQYLYNSINLFKYNSQDLNDYVIHKCHDNPLIYIDEETMPLSVLSYKQNGSGEGMLSELFHHFNCMLSGEEQNVMHHLLYSLNANGFLEANTSEVASTLNSDVNQVTRLIDLLKSYDDHRGIGCRNVMEFLEFQLKHQCIFNGELFSIFASHMEQVSKGDYTFLNTLKTDEEEFLSYVELIKDSCELLPMSGDDMAYIEPDAAITLDDKGELKITINDFLTESIVFEPIALNSADTAFKQQIDSYKKAYEELCSILNARRVYLADVLACIVNIQKDYLTHFTGFLNPLDQTMLSEDTSLSPATISRLLDNKFVSTPRGVMPIKALLSKKCSNNASVSYVMHLIENVTDFEHMSDNKISRKLNEQGVNIARRTVNKYKNILLKQI